MTRRDTKLLLAVAGSMAILASGLIFCFVTGRWGLTLLEYATKNNLFEQGLSYAPPSLLIPVIGLVTLGAGALILGVALPASNNGRVVAVEGQRLTWQQPPQQWQQQPPQQWHQPQAPPWEQRPQQPPRDPWRPPPPPPV